MSDRARRKEKHRIKRQQKQLAQRRAAGISPYKSLARGTEIEACYINEDWQENGIAAIRMIGHAPGGKLVLAAFLVDVWCIGLKDAFGRLDLHRDEIERNLKAGNFTVVRIDVEKARKLVAGAVRFSRKNGFRLPKNYDRWTAFLGGLGDVESADISNFGKEGKLRFVGELDDLKARLISCSVDEFLSRPDVDFIAGIGKEELFEEDDEFDDEFDDDDDVMDEEDFESAIADSMDFQSKGIEILVGIILECQAKLHEPPVPYLAELIRWIFLNTMAEEFEPIYQAIDPDGDMGASEIVEEASRRLLFQQAIQMKDLTEQEFDTASRKAIDLIGANKSQLKVAANEYCQSWYSSSGPRTANQSQP